MFHTQSLTILLTEKAHGANVVLPVFVSVDPARDPVPQVKKYLAGQSVHKRPVMSIKPLFYFVDFHPKMVGLTGSYDEVKQMCKAYRVYFSTPPDVKNGSSSKFIFNTNSNLYPLLIVGEDYLVDHSIYFYLMAPEGSFVNAFGKATTAAEVKQKFEEAVADWKPSSVEAN